MIKRNLMKALMLGVCLSALTTGTAFAKMVASTPPSSGTEVQSDLTKELYAEQDEINQYIFTDHSKELIDKGITVNYTGVSDEYVEIGISPYTDDNANYFYKVFGKDMIKVVAYDESVMYATSVAGTGAAESGVATVSGVGTADPGTASSSSVIDTDKTGVTNPVNTIKEQDGTVYTQKEEIAPDASVSSDVQPASDGKVYKETMVKAEDGNTEPTTDQSSESTNATDDHVIYYTTAANPESAEVQTTSVKNNGEAVKRSTEEDGNGVSAPLTILVVAGVAAIVGSAILTSKKKKNTK